MESNVNEAVAEKIDMGQNLNALMASAAVQLVRVIAGRCYWGNGGSSEVSSYCTQGKARQLNVSNNII